MSLRIFAPKPTDTAMRSCVATTIMVVAAAACIGMIGPSRDAVAAQVSAVEFYHAEFDHFFLATYPNEMASLDRGATKGWERGWVEFKVNDGPGPGLVPACRFFSASFAPKSSHFFTAFADECAAVKANPTWTFEADAFYVQLPDSLGRCAVGTMPIYRSYNGGTGGAPAHRFTPYPQDSCAWWSWSCVREGPGPGVAFCAPVFLELAQQRTQQLSGGTWEFSYTIDGVPHMYSASYGNAVADQPLELPPHWWPFWPYIAHGGNSIAGWDPIAGKITVTTPDGVFQFDFDGGNAASGCAFKLGDDLFENIRGPCYPMTARRL